MGGGIVYQLWRAALSPAFQINLLQSIMDLKTTGELMDWLFECMEIYRKSWEPPIFVDSEWSICSEGGWHQDILYRALFSPNLFMVLEKWCACVLTPWPAETLSSACFLWKNITKYKLFRGSLTKINLLSCLCSKETILHTLWRYSPSTQTSWHFGRRARTARGGADSEGTHTGRANALRGRYQG